MNGGTSSGCSHWQDLVVVGVALVGGSKESHDQHWIGTRPPVDRETVQSGARRLITFMRQMRGDGGKA